MTTVAIDFRTFPRSGIERYSRELAARLPQAMPWVKVFELRDTLPVTPGALNRIKRGAMRMGQELLTLDRRLRSAGVDLFHCTKNYGVPLRGQTPVVTTVHDIIPLSLRKEYSGSWLKYRAFFWNFMNSLRISRRIVTISAFSRDEVLRFAPWAREKVVVVPNGCDQEFGASLSREQAREVMATQGVKCPYVLTMGGSEPRKNVEMLLKLHEANPDALLHDLVIIGGDWYGRKLPASSRAGQVHILERVPHDVVVAAYKAAEVFVFPSLYEGFGLPVLEAMACGTPVLAHNGASIPEVTGEAAALCDMRAPQACLAVLRRLLEESSLRDEL